MLVLTRKQDQRIHIGDEIVLTVTRIRGNTVRLGIEAPDTYRIRRGELERHDDSEANNRPMVSDTEGGRRCDEPSSKRTPWGKGVQSGETSRLRDGRPGRDHDAPLGLALTSRFPS